MKRLLNNAPVELPEKYKDEFEQLTALLKDVKLVEDPPGSGWFEFADPGMIPFLQSMKLGFTWMIGFRYLGPDDPLRHTLYWCTVHLTAAQGDFEDEHGRLWSMQQLKDANALIRRNDGGIESITFPYRIDELGNIHYPKDQTAERRAGRNGTPSPDDPAGEQTHGYDIF